MANVYELLGREKKAAAIAVVLQRHGVSALDMERGDAADWERVATAAHVWTPSEATKAAVLEMLRKQEAPSGK